MDNAEGNQDALEFLVVQVGYSGIVDDDGILVVHILCRRRPVVRARNHRGVIRERGVVHDGILVVQVPADVVVIDLDAIGQQVFVLAAGGVDLLDATDGVDEETLPQGGNRIAQVVPGQGEQGKLEFAVCRLDFLSDGIGGPVRRREVQFNRHPSDHEIDGRIPRLVRAELGVCGIGRHPVRAPHFIELDGVGPGQTLVLEYDGVVQVLDEVSRGEVGRTRQHEGGFRILGVTYDELVVHATALAIRAGVGHNGLGKVVESDVGILALIDPTDLDAVVGCRFEGVLQCLVVEVVCRDIQGVLG